MKSDGIVLRKYLLASIADGTLTRGAQVPAERSLAARFGLSRAAVRDVLLALQAEGHLDRRHGSGTFVAGAVPLRPGGTETVDVSPAQLMEARLAIEPQFADLVVAHATAADLATIEACNRRTADADSSDAFGEWNRRLHRAIAAATHNDFLIRVFGLVIESQQHPAWGELTGRAISPALRKEYQCEHDAIVDALKARNVVAARNAISGHLRHARLALLG